MACKKVVSPIQLIPSGKVMKHSMIKVVHIEFLEEYSIRVRFEDGKSVDIDFGRVLIGPLFGPLKNMALFKGAELDAEAGTIVWPNGADFDPDTLYNWESVSDELVCRLSKNW